MKLNLSVRRDARLPDVTATPGGDVAPERKRASGVRYTQALFIFVAVSTTLLILCAAGGQQRLELVGRGGASTSVYQTTDGVWTGVGKDIPELCRAGPDLVCDKYEAVVLLGGGPANKDGTLPEWVKRRCDLVLQLYKCCSEARAAQQRESPTFREQQPAIMKIITTSAGGNERNIVRPN